MQLPQPLCDMLGLPVDATALDLLTFIREGQLDLFDGLLTSEESLAAAEESLDSLPNYHLRIEDQIATWQSKFCSVIVGACPTPVLVGLMGAELVEAPPTALENLLFWAILNAKLPFQQSINTDGSRFVVDWRGFAKGKAIVAEPIGSNFVAADQQLISALFGLSHPSVPVTVQPKPLVSSATAISVATRSGKISSTQVRLLFEASSSQHPKWRLLSLYRILENAYLANIRDTLLREFDLDASKAVTEAQSKLKSEVKQLVDLAEQADLMTEFEVFNTQVDALLQVGNSYITLLDRSASTDQLYSAKEPYKKAVLRFYKMRCSIAHAGTSDVIYEQFPDANLATLDLLPVVETIALKSLGITVPPQPLTNL